MDETAERDPAADAAEYEGLRRGDRRVFEAFYRDQSGLVYGMCVRLTQSRTEAEELTQEVFVRAWQNRESFASLDHARNWLRTVALNLWRNSLRKHARRGEPLELDERRFPAPVPARRHKLDIEGAVAGLPPRAREFLILHDVLGYRHQEIAELLDVTVNASKVQLHRARKRLREVLR